MRQRGGGRQGRLFRLPSGFVFDGVPKIALGLVGGGRSGPVAEACVGRGGIHCECVNNFIT